MLRSSDAESWFRCRCGSGTNLIEQCLWITKVLRTHHGHPELIYDCLGCLQGGKVFFLDRRTQGGGFFSFLEAARICSSACHIGAFNFHMAPGVFWTGLCCCRR